MNKFQIKEDIMWQNIINTALTMLVGLTVTAMFNGAINLPKKKKAEDAQREEDVRLLKKGIQALLKNDLKVRYDYWLDQEYAPEDAREDLEAEYRIYHSLGKNGVMDSRRANFLDLPIDPPEEAEV
jgi:nuclear transport factor 2 (NTF2) superfamily protein